MNLQSFVIYFAAAFFFLYGLAFTVFPEGMAYLVTESEPRGISALVDFRATYGGMTAAVGATLFYLHSINQIRPSLVIIIFVLIGMAIARTFGLLVEGEGNFMMYLYLLLEVAGSALAWFALQRIPEDT